MNTISTEALTILSESQLKEFSIALPSLQMERPLYEEVNEVLTRLGGKWKSKGKTTDGIPKGEHLFPYNPSSLFAAVLESGEMPPKNPTAFFPTPKAIVNQMVEWAELKEWSTDDWKILEPSAGTGAIADAIREAAPLAKLDLVEYLHLNAVSLRSKGYEVQEMDFMNWAPDYQYDAILMNPPFSLDHDKKAYISHIHHAWSLLREDGILVAIAPLGFSFASDTTSKEFLNHIIEFGEWTELPDKSFKESGTGVQTCMIYLKKQNTDWKEKPHCGYPSYYTWEISLYVDNTREVAEEYDRLVKKIALGCYEVDMFGNPGNELKAMIKAFYEETGKKAQKERVRFMLDEKSLSDLYRLVMIDVDEQREDVDFLSQAG